jgi:cobalt-zinc-cadmium efflux system membrane fusion protein
VSFEVSALADQLRVLGMTPQAIEHLATSRKINSSAPLTAGLAGTVISRSIAPGQVLQATDDAFVIADLSHVWVVAEVPEQAASDLSVGQQVRLRFPALDEEAPRVGELIHISATVNPETRTIAVRSDVDNTDGRLKPDMLAIMEIHARTQHVPIIDARAVVRENNLDHVFVEQPDGSFRLTPVTLGPERDGQRPVLGGLDVGTRIVTDGAFHLNNERRRQELE